MVYRLHGVPYVPSDELCHYGRRGMRWGQHIFGDEKKLGAAASAGKSTSSAFNEAAKIADRASKRNAVSREFRNEVQAMSDDDLRKLVNRMNLERQYATLRGADKRRGAEVTREVLQATGSIVGIASGIATTAMLLRKLT